MHGSPGMNAGVNRKKPGEPGCPACESQGRESGEPGRRACRSPAPAAWFTMFFPVSPGIHAGESGHRRPSCPLAATTREAYRLNNAVAICPIARMPIKIDIIRLSAPLGLNFMERPNLLLARTGPCMSRDSTTACLSSIRLGAIAFPIRAAMSSPFAGRSSRSCSIHAASTATNSADIPAPATAPSTHPPSALPCSGRR